MPSRNNNLPAEPVTAHLSRRVVLKHLGALGAGLILADDVVLGQSGDIVVAGKSVKNVISSVGPLTLRLTVTPLENDGGAALPTDGALVSGSP